MDWNKLLLNGRRKDKFKAEKNGQPFPESNHGMLEKKGAREELERDFDRVLFLAATRRLSDKTQVFPLEQNDSVRTRLTHSHEVSNLARSIGTQLAYEEPSHFEGHKLDKRNGNLTRSLPSLLAAIGLAHDLGNPPFGHQGESAIRDWFQKKNEKEQIFVSTIDGEDSDIYNDFLNFDGNSQTIRLVAKLQILNDDFGLNLTYASLAAMLKYPVSSKDIKKGTCSKVWEKHGFFYSEEKIVKEIWEQTGLQQNIRHPLTYIMEACDDIAYSVLDAEDIVKKGLASFQDLIGHLKYHVACEKNNQLEKDKKFDLQVSVVQKVIDDSEKDHAKFSDAKLDLTPAELNDVSMQMFRVHAIRELVNSVTQAFIQNKDVLENVSTPQKDLMSLSDGIMLCKGLKKFDKKWGYRNKAVLELELQGHNYIHSLMDMLWEGIHGKLNKDAPKNSDTPFGKYAYGRISENYRRIFEDDSNELPETYKEAQLLTDAVSGMTDSYLITLHNELVELYRK